MQSASRVVAQALTIMTLEIDHNESVEIGKSADLTRSEKDSRTVGRTVDSEHELFLFRGLGKARLRPWGCVV
jgi:hypothetical protein